MQKAMCTIISKYHHFKVCLLLCKNKSTKLLIIPIKAIQQRNHKNGRSHTY